jgi:hypothetical protein
MSHYRLMRRLVALAALAACANIGCSSDDDDDEEEGSAVMKFCNGLSVEDPTTGEDVEIALTLTFAGGEATAVSGACSPIVPNECIEITPVVNPTVELSDTEDGTVYASGAFANLTVAAGDEMLMLADLDDMGYPTVLAISFAELYGDGFSCADTDPLTTDPPNQLRNVSLGFDSKLRLDSRVAPRFVRRATSATRLGR